MPAIQLVTGSMLTGSHRGERVGACTDCRRYWGRYRAEEIDAEEIADVNNQLVASVGTCSVMGTASTMACLTEALGMMVAGGASAPAVTADRVRVAEHTGASAVALARSRLTPDRIITGKSIENAARAAGHRRLDQWHRPPDRHRRPTGHRHRSGRPGPHEPRDAGAGGPEAPASTTWKTSTTPAACPLLRELRPLLHLDALTVSGRTLGEELDDAPAPFPRT